MVDGPHINFASDLQRFYFANQLGTRTVYLRLFLTLESSHRHDHRIKISIRPDALARIFGCVLQNPAPGKQSGLRQKLGV